MKKKVRQLSIIGCKENGKMRADGISTYLINHVNNGSQSRLKHVSEAPVIASPATKVPTINDTAEEAKNFADMLKEEITNLTEFTDLANTMSGSVLSSVTGSISNLTSSISGSMPDSTSSSSESASAAALASLSNDLMNTGGGREVISKLAEGHLDSLVL